MARPATPGWTAGRRAGRLDRPAGRHVPVDLESPAAPGPSPAAAGPRVPAAPDDPAEQETIVPVTPAAFWALLPATERDRLGRRLSQLVLRAVRPPVPTAEEDCG